MNPVLAHVLELFEQRGSAPYGGECVTQLEHALQCAALAEADGAGPELITASLLHDLGHLVHDLGDDAAEHGVDDKHEFRALHLLRRAFTAPVLEPIRLHVDAKRYLCIADQGYHALLSPASQLSLSLQGGAFDAHSARHFIEQPCARDAVRLRLWDDLAKIPGATVPTLEHYAGIMARCTM